MTLSFGIRPYPYGQRVNLLRIKGNDFKFSIGVQPKLWQLVRCKNDNIIVILGIRFHMKRVANHG